MCAYRQIIYAEFCWDLPSGSLRITPLSVEDCWCWILASCRPCTSWVLHTSKVCITAHPWPSLPNSSNSVWADNSLYSIPSCSLYLEWFLVTLLALTDTWIKPSTMRPVYQGSEKHYTSKWCPSHRYWDIKCQGTLSHPLREPKTKFASWLPLSQGQSCPKECWAYHHGN